MDDPALVGHFHRARQDLHQLGGRSRGRSGSRRSAGRGCRRRRIRAKNRAGLRARQSRRSARCSNEAAWQRLPPRRETAQANLADVRSGQNHLERDQPLQPAVPRLVDDPHSAAAELFEDVVTRHGHAAQRRRTRVESSLSSLHREEPGLPVGTMLDGTGPRHDHTRRGKSIFFTRFCAWASIH